ncbi:hypothetical protein FRC10_008646 [Ceratobasidium sp. 414]|nr:hypothetical protein FRC10_008646 [Ceratobasidium sp. 414]
MLVPIKAILLVALSGLALAIPAPTKTTPLEKRIISGVTGADCDGSTFTADQVAAAASAAASHIASHTSVGFSKYPHVFNNHEGKSSPEPSPLSANILMAPTQASHSILAAVLRFTSSRSSPPSPGANRVVVGSVSGSDAAFCDVITHIGATGNGFLQCDNA